MKKLIVILAAFLGGCFSPPQRNLMLEEARSGYASASNDAAVLQAAPANLNQAREELQRAEKFFNDDAPPEEITHHAYLAKQHIAIARESAKREQAETAIARGGIERENLLLQERATQAQANVKEAQLARERAEAKAREAEIARYEMEQRTRVAEAARLDALARARDAQSAMDAQSAAQAKESRSKSAPTELNMRETSRGVVVTVGDGLFDEAALGGSAKPVMDKLAAYLKKYPRRNIVVEGFTDSLGSADYNRYFSEQRGNAVRQALLARGIAAERIAVRGIGAERPAASNETAAGREQNRRVEVVIINNGVAGRSDKDIQ